MYPPSQPIAPIRFPLKFPLQSPERLAQLQAATLGILAEIGVRFPSPWALRVFAEHGAPVDHDTQIVRIPAGLVLRALHTAPRHFLLGARDPACTIHLEDGGSYLTTDACGVETIDYETRVRRPSCLDDVAKSARIADYLPSVGVYWPMVSAQEYGATAALQELAAAWRNTGKHVQTASLTGAAQARYALEMAQVVAGGSQALAKNPLLSVLTCPVTPLRQDKESIECAMVMAQAGVPVGVMSMPTHCTTAPATIAGALVLGDAEVISTIVLLQLLRPGTPVLHSVIRGWTDPHTGRYMGYPLDARAAYAAVEMAHHWGLPCIAPAFGTDAREPGCWQSGVESIDPLLVGLTGPELLCGSGLNGTYTVLYPEGLVLDDDIYHRARYALMDFAIDSETLALDLIKSVGPGGNFLAEPHTARHVREISILALTQQRGPGGAYRDPREVARVKAAWILQHHRPLPLEPVQEAELDHILAVAGRHLQPS